MTALLGLCALPLLLTTRFWQAPQVPSIVLLPIGLMLVLLVQFIVGRIVYFDHVLLLSLYFLFAALLMMLGHRLREEFGLPFVAMVLASFLLLGAELNTLAGILQHYHWNTFFNSVITVKTSSSVYGNTAQPNHFANFIALGLVSLGFLHYRLSLRVWQTILLAMPMLFVLVLSGSRSAWLYLTFTLLLAWLWQRKDVTLRPVMFFSLILWLGFLVMHFVVQLPFLEGTSGNITSADRLFGEAGGGSVRFHLWREGWLIFTQYPILGSGFGQFAYQHLQLAMSLHNSDISGLYNNAHNIVLQIAAEAGLAGVVVLLGTLGMWFRQSVVRDVRFTPEHWWGFAILAILGIHSLLEYPLWYLYFVGIGAILLGLFDVDSYRLELRVAGRISVVVIILLGAISLLQGLQSYRHLEKALSFRSLATKDHSYVSRARDEFMAAHQYPLFGSYAELFIAGMLQPSADHLKEKLELNGRALRYIPVAPVAYHEALFLALSERDAEAKDMLMKAIWAYPADFLKARIELEEMARKEPVRFNPLLEFATQKYEEYQRAAVPRK